MEALPGDESGRHDDEEDIPDEEDKINLLIDDIDGEGAHSRHSDRFTSVTKVLHVAGHH